MREELSHFRVIYQGKDADRHILEAGDLGQSIIGASRLYTKVAHYILSGQVPRGSYRKVLRCYVRPASRGSWDQLWSICLVANEYISSAQMYNFLLGYFFSKALDCIISAWRSPSETPQISHRLGEEIFRKMSEIESRLEEVHYGLSQQNSDLISTTRNLSETFSELVDSTRPNGRKFVQPLGRTCSRISLLFPEDSREHVILESDAEMIRIRNEIEEGPSSTFRIIRINSLSINTGVCSVYVEGISSWIRGEITDPALSIPGNIYTRAFSNHSGLVVRAIPLLRYGRITRLRIQEVMSRNRS